jgi:import inner membrane translocase subunit TIM50
LTSLPAGMFSVILRSAAQRRALPALRYLSTANPPPSPPQNPPPPPPSSLPSLDFQPAEPEKTQRTGAKSSKDSLSSIERKRRFLGRLSLGVLAVALGVQVVYLGREWEADELKARKQVRMCNVGFSSSLITSQKTLEESPSGRWARTKSRFAELFDVCAPTSCL